MCIREIAWHLVSMTEIQRCIQQYFPWHSAPEGYRRVVSDEIGNPNCVLNVVFSNNTPNSVSINEMGQHYGYPAMKQNVTAAARITYFHPSGSIIAHPKKGIMSGPVHPFTQISTALAYLWHINVRMFYEPMPLMYVSTFEGSVNQVVTAKIEIPNLKQNLSKIIHPSRITSLSKRESFPATFISFDVPPHDIKVTTRIFDTGSVCINGVPNLIDAVFIMNKLLDSLDAYLRCNVPLPVNVPHALQVEAVKKRKREAKASGERPKRATIRKKARVDQEKTSILDAFRPVARAPEELDIMAIIAEMDSEPARGFFDS